MTKSGRSTSTLQAQAKREYRSPLREQQARRTERRIVDAAAELFTGKGWSKTTMADVAGAAEISNAMLYKVFRTKADLIKRTYDIALVGDQEKVPFRERPEFQAVLREADPTTKLLRYVHLIRITCERVLPIYQQLRAATVAGDEELRTVAATADAERLFGATNIVEDLTLITRLRLGLDEDRAVDIVWMAMSPEFWELLVRRRGWSWDDAEHWVGTHLQQTLLG